MNADAAAGLGTGIDAAAGDAASPAALIGSLGGLCRQTGDAVRACEKCPRETVADCMGALMEICGRLLVLQVEHFEREEAIMAALPPDPRVRAYCDRHRNEHANFTLLYNLTMARLDVQHVATGAATLETFVREWLRHHAIEYDMASGVLAKPG